MSDPASHYDGEFRFGRPKTSDLSMFIQWKGTDVCMDVQCPCGHNGHFDGYFAYYLVCPECGTHYQLATQVVARRVDPEKVLGNPKAFTSDGDIE